MSLATYHASGSTTNLTARLVYCLRVARKGTILHFQILWPYELKDIGKLHILLLVMWKAKFVGERGQNPDEFEELLESFAQNSEKVTAAAVKQHNQ